MQSAKLKNAGIFLCDFFLHDYILMQLETSHHFSNLRDNVRFNMIWHRGYAIIFSLMQFGTDEMWQHLSCVGG